MFKADANIFLSHQRQGFRQGEAILSGIFPCQNVEVLVFLSIGLAFGRSERPTAARKQLFAAIRVLLGFFPQYLRFFPDNIEGVEECSLGSSLEDAEDSLELGNTAINGIEVGGIHREMLDVSSLWSNSL